MCFFLLVAEVRGMYSSWRAIRFLYEIREVLYVWLVVVLVLLFLALLTGTLNTFAPGEKLSWFVVVPVTLILFRASVRVLLEQMRMRGYNSRVIAIVGHNSMGLNLAQRLEALPWAGLHVKCFFDYRQSKNIEERMGTSKYDVKPINELIGMACSGGIDCVYIALPTKSSGRVEHLIGQLADSTASVYVLPDLFISELMRLRWTNQGGMPIICVHETPFYGIDGYVKRLMRPR